MLNHTYTSVKNANLVNCGKKQHISSQPSPLLKENFLGEFRTELDKKKVLANLGIASSLSLEWEYIKGDIARSEALMQELDARTTYTSKITGDIQTLIDGVLWLESIVGSEQDSEEEQNNRLQALETSSKSLASSLQSLKDYINNTISIDVNKLKSDVADITDKVNNITDLIKVSEKEGNALYIEEGDAPGLYVPDLSGRIDSLSSDVDAIQKDVQTVKVEYVKREEFGDGDLNFVSQSDYDSFSDNTDNRLGNLEEEIKNTVKTGEDGHVDTLYVNKVSKDNDSGNIVITDSFEMESGIPLDVRFVVENLEELCNLSAKKCYSGMGVIVNSLSALYILRKPEEGTRLDQDYVSNIYNWKCPEDLVTVALSRQEYEALEEINPNVFYYVYEEEIKRTQEPKPEEFGSTEEYEKAFNDWVDSLKTLSQEYMSAAWGVDIENKLGKKANQTSVNVLNTNIKDLQEQINALSGGDSETSLSSLAERLSIAESDLDFLLGTDGSDEEPSTQGKIVEIESEIANLNSKVETQYVSKESITTENDTTDYIFVKKSEYSKDVTDREAALSESVTTKQVTTDSISTSEITLSNVVVTSNGSDLLLDSKEIALVENVPKIIYLTQAEYDDLLDSGELDPEAYYYTTDEEIYVTKTDFDTKTTQINTSITAANAAITTLNGTVEQMQKQIDVLLETIESLQNRLTILEGTSEEVVQ